jgi:hypothetical protein
VSAEALAKGEVGSSDLSAVLSDVALANLEALAKEEAAESIKA